MPNFGNQEHFLFGYNRLNQYYYLLKFLNWWNTCTSDIYRRWIFWFIFKKKKTHKQFEAINACSREMYSRRRALEEAAWRQFFFFYKNKTKEGVFSYVDMVCSSMLWGLNKNASTHRIPHISKRKIISQSLPLSCNFLFSNKKI